MYIFSGPTLFFVPPLLSCLIRSKPYSFQTLFVSWLPRFHNFPHSLLSFVQCFPPSHTSMASLEPCLLPFHFFARSLSWRHQIMNGDFYFRDVGAFSRVIVHGERLMSILFGENYDLSFSRNAGKSSGVHLKSKLCFKTN